MSTLSIRRVANRLLGRGSATAPAAREQQAGWYDSMYAKSSGYQAHYSKSHYYFLWSVIVDRVRAAGIRRVLEIGCGPGQLAAYLLDQGLEEYHGLDFSPQAIEFARKNAPRGRFVVGDARTTTLHESVAHDLVICTEVLEHIQDDLPVVSRFRPGTRCLCTVPNFAHESHVRQFGDAGEVAARYGPFFRSIDVTTFISPNWEKDRFYLLDGVRNDHREPAEAH